MQIVREFGTIARFNGVRATIKLQSRDVDNFSHRDFRDLSDIRYIKKTIDTQLTRDQRAILVEEIRKRGCILSHPLN